MEIKKKIWVKEISNKSEPIWDFMEASLCSLADEIQKTGEAFSVGGSETSEKNLFGQNERTWIGLLNNAMIRKFGSEVVMIQEYGVYENDKHQGRADFLVRYANQNFLFEAKQYEELNVKTLLDENHEDHTNIFNQALKYYSKGNNEDIQKRYPTKVISILFGWMRKEDMISVALDYFKTEENKRYEDFCGLYHIEKKYGMWVYGKIIDPK